MSEKSEALRLADALMEEHPFPRDIRLAAAELRRLHAQRDALRAELKEATEAINDPAVNNLRTLPESIRVLCAQRDALLEALKRMASIIDKMGDMPDGFIHPSPWQELKCEEALTQARAAIKSVGEGR